jgi:hypothetical protein
MMKKRIKKIFKLTVLIGARQIWKLLCNLYHLITEPISTIKILIKERDKSQIFLILLVFSIPIISYFLARIVWDYYRYGTIVKDVGGIFIAAIIVQILLLWYLGYWVLKVVSKKHD